MKILSRQIKSLTQHASKHNLIWRINITLNTVLAKMQSAVSDKFKTKTVIYASENPFIHLTTYDLRHIISHLSFAGRIREAFLLLQTEIIQKQITHVVSPQWARSLVFLLNQQYGSREFGRLNAWFNIKEGMGDTDGYVRDLESIWQTAEAQSINSINRGRKPVNLGNETRIGLMYTSHLQLARDVTPPLLLQFLKHQLWTPLQGLAYIRQMPSEKRGAALPAIISYIPTNLHDEIKAISQTIEHPDERLLARINIWSILSDNERLQLLDETFSEDTGFKWTYQDDEFLAQLVKLAPESRRSDLLNKYLEQVGLRIRHYHGLFIE